MFKKLSSLKISHKMRLCIKHRGRFYDFIDVEGDGNCLFNVLSLSPLIEGNTGREVRNMMILMLKAISSTQIVNSI